MGYNICIAGLGLMGASMARALRGFKDAEITGVDTDSYTRAKAVETRTVTRAFASLKDAAPDADLIVFCVYSEHIPKMLVDAEGCFKPSAVLSDICGVKHELYAKIQGLIPETADYIGIHPMAGKERDGFDNADGELFRNTGFIICPLERTKPESVALMRELAAYIGATRLDVTPYGRHDEIIAFTSDLMHIASAALCMKYHPDMSSAYTAGAFRDCTRIADINAGAWSALLTENSANILPFLDAYIDNLRKMRDTMADKDREALFSLLETAGQNKREMLKR